MDDTLTVTKPLRAFLTEYHKNYVTERALVSQNQLLPRAGKRPEVMINKQFSRDVPNLLRINGHPCAGETPEDKIRFAYDNIVRAVDGNTEKAQRITLVANQNLGIFMYELLVKANSHRKDVVVMQVGEHHLDVRTMRRGIVIVFEALFRLQKNDSIELEGDVVKGFAKVDFVHKNVSFRFSKPKSS
ncbi:hypothetical protein GUITHDRAFT_154224 [Guillardia theta CCMP2712]|uniref:Uncharacterized protein n=1 Tax=Guillardia theta (strain CCMP2712) TaxID=905079 RepID=L1IW27_GUITC|nr:hypothetical protein GUITHDRAFT_154224 [Guillardia theta CCMP2712]EKX40050.1 hypothetical protein GUITHDRAFT_154224 [Guillardia theta CCMP2712]|eukprot:XP_005827030.1 hypothetical protein GUITHDRAFT_154224 [Guillardia theta CCMP2712]